MHKSVCFLSICIVSYIHCCDELDSLETVQKYLDHPDQIDSSNVRCIFDKEEYKIFTDNKNFTEYRWLTKSEKLYLSSIFYLIAAKNLNWQIAQVDEQFPKFKELRNRDKDISFLLMRDAPELKGEKNSGSPTQNKNQLPQQLVEKSKR